MALRLPRHDPSLEGWLRRLDRAAGRMNPYLCLVVIGLIMLNLACLALLVPGLPITRHPAGIAACPAVAPATTAAERRPVDPRALSAY